MIDKTGSGRGDRAKRLGLSGAAALALLALAGAAYGQMDARRVIGELRADRLYLRTGDVDTTTWGPVDAMARGADAGTRLVLQLDGPMTPERRAKLEATGLRIGEYLPKDAFVVSLENADRAALAGLDFVRGAAPFANEWKLDPEIGLRDYQTAERQVTRAKGLVTVAVTLFQGERDAAELTNFIAGLPGGVVHYVEAEGESIEIGATMRFNDTVLLTEFEEVMFVEDAPENTFRSNTNNRWIVQSNIAGVHPLYDNGLHGEGQIVGVIDGAIAQSHCSFSDAQPIGPTHRKFLAYNNFPGSNSHGTHVAGTVAGDGGADNNTRGVAYMAKIVANSIPSPQNEANITQRLALHYSQGARVHTNSWGDDGTTQYTGQCRGIDSHVYSNEDSLVLFAVTNTSSLRTPENAKNLLAVGATQPSPNQHQHCYGGTGPTNDGRRKPEIYAPGCSTVSSSGTGCGTASLSGTSMACPAVAGTAVLVRQYYTDGYYPTGAANPSDGFVPSAALIKATLLDSTVDMTGVTGYPSAREGWGRVLADNALYFPGDSRRLIAMDVRNADGLSTGAVVEEVVNVEAGVPLEVTLVWTDPPATVSTTFAAINDLDLEVDGPDGLFRGNVFNAAGVSATGGSKDDRNNVEKVLINAPTAGEWTVRIKAAGVNVGTQGYAVVITGAVNNQVAPPCCMGNADGIGGVDFDDITAIIANWGVTYDGAGPGDGNCDGTVDFDDVNAVLAEFGSSCL